MFIGHFALGFAGKRFAPRVSLGTLFLAAQFVDLLWPTLLLLGIESVRIAPGDTAFTPLDFQHYPWSHSLLMVLLWGIGFAIVYGLMTRYRKGAILAGVLVVSHWLLDMLVHRPDLPLFPGSEAVVGLGLWNSIPLTLLLELGLFAACAWLYLRVTRATDRTGHWALYGLVAFLLLIQFANAFGEPPPSVQAIAWIGQAQWLLVVWGYWIDRHRAVVKAR